MELDLNSLLNSQISSDDDDDDEDNGDLNSLHRRTVDEILQDSDSDSDSGSSASSSPPSALPRHDDLDRSIRSSQASVSARPSSDGAKSTESEERSVGTRTGSVARFKSGESSPEEFFRRASISKPLPSLFGGVRSNVKPGAALAAAAAASRSVPSPHAAAIKSRRSVGNEGARRALDGGELGFDSNGGLSPMGLEIGRSVAKSVEDSNGGEVFESSLEMGEVLHDKAMEKEVGESMGVSVEPQNNSTSVDVEKDVAFDENSHVSCANEIEKNLGSEFNSADENGSGFDKVPTFSVVPDDNENGSSNNGGIAEDLTNVEFELGDSVEDDVHVSEDNDKGVAGDDASVNGDIDELVEERLGKLEIKRVGQRAEKKALPRMKPLELAEELEKKHASTGLHWEEGAAAQPMRLEGVRRGSIMLGYFDVDASNTITRTISSQAFRRDYGSPQVLAVHANYIAVGMARGVIVVVPSRYSAHKADEMDAKVEYDCFPYSFYILLSLLHF